MVIMVVIVLFLADQYLFVGVALGTWAVISQIILPVMRGMRFLFTHPSLTGQRARATVVSLSVMVGLLACLAYLPVSLSTQVEGIIWVPEQAQVFAGADGFVEELLVSSGEKVAEGTILIRLSSPSLEARIAVLEARYRELEIRRAAEQLEQRIKSLITSEEMAAVEAELRLLKEQEAALQVRSEVAGTFVTLDQDALQGRYLHQGQLIGYLITPERLIVRSVVPQSAIGLVRRQVDKVEVRLAERLDETIEASILREIPAGSSHLPSRALGAAGGGEIAVRMSDETGVTAAEEVFHFDLALPDDLNITGLGERAYVRFDHGSQPLARQWLRSGRQLVLSRLSL
jgi:putative peptide zinc metalloprotease protein